MLTTTAFVRVSTDQQLGSLHEDMGMLQAEVRKLTSNMDRVLKKLEIRPEGEK